MIIAPSNQTLTTLIGSCAANYTIADPIADNCTGSTWTYALSGSTTAATSSAINDGANATNLFFNKGVTTVTLNGVDAVTNAAVQKTFTVTVNDNVAPIITCQGDITVNTTTNLCTATPTLTTSMTDNCSIGNGLNFDGTNDLVTINSNSSLNSSTAFTYEAWIYVQSPSDPFPTIYSRASNKPLLDDLDAALLLLPTLPAGVEDSAQP